MFGRGNPYGGVFAFFPLWSSASDVLFYSRCFTLPIDFGMPISSTRVIALLNDAKGPPSNDDMIEVSVAIQFISLEGP
jgi:hypothetical protein